MFGRFLLTCMLVVVFSPTLGLFASVDDNEDKTASDQALLWLREMGLTLGWNPQQKVVVSLGYSMDDLHEMSGHYEVRRDAGFFSAYRGMLINMLKVIRQTVTLQEASSVVERCLVDGDGEGTVEDLFKEIVRPWAEREASGFVWRYCGVEDDLGHEIAVLSNRRKIQWSSDMKVAIEGTVNGLQVIRYFETVNKEDGTCEFAVVGVKYANKSEGFIKSFEEGGAADWHRGDLSFDKWLSEQDVNSLVGTRVYCDRDGKCWAVGVAPIEKGDIQTARNRARLWAAFALGGYVHVECRSLWTAKKRALGFDGKREILDARRTVVGQSYPEKMCQYRFVKGKRETTGENCMVVVCVLPSGTRTFRQREFGQTLENQVRHDFVTGKRESIKMAENVVRERLKSLNGTGNDKKRKALWDMLKELERVKNEL